MNVCSIFWAITKLALPCIVGLLCESTFSFSCIYFIGTIDEPSYIAGVALGVMTINFLAFTLSWGLNGTIETFVSQSFGAQKFEQCGTVLNRGKIIVTLFLLPVYVLFLFMEPVFISLNQDAEVARIAGTYIRVCIPGLWAFSMSDATRRFMSAQLETKIIFYV